MNLATRNVSRARFVVSVAALLSAGCLAPSTAYAQQTQEQPGAPLQSAQSLQLSAKNLRGGWPNAGLAYYVDADERTDIADVSRATNPLEFTPLTSDTAHFGFDARSNYWFRLRVHNPDALPIDWILEIDNPFVDEIVLYRPAARPGTFESFATGDRRPFAERDIAYRAFAFRMRTPPGDAVYYLRLRNPALARFPVRVWSPAAFTEHRLLDWLGHGMIFGALAILLLANLLLCAAVRDPAYLYLLVFIPGIAFLYLLLTGFGFQFFWPNLPVLNESIITVIPVLATGFVGYLRHVLETRILVPRLDLVLRVLLGICLSFAVLNLFLPYARLAQIASFAAVPVIGLLLAGTVAVGLAAIGADEPAGKFYLVGSVLFAITVGVAGNGLFGVLPDAFGLRILGRVCSLALIALMTVAVHYKLKLIRDNLQRLNAQKSREPASEITGGLASTGASETPNDALNERTPGTNGNGGNWTIGPRMEQKLQQALFYLKENFRSDISREGLAARLEVNADNLGRFFLIYTGDKLGDYVNKLRIEAAARRLHDAADLLIADVAAEVGFENVSTFNRTFKKIMGCTPSEYRQRLEQGLLAARETREKSADTP